MSYPPRAPGRLQHRAAWNPAGPQRTGQRGIARQVRRSVEKTQKMWQFLRGLRLNAKIGIDLIFPVVPMARTWEAQ